MSTSKMYLTKAYPQLLGSRTFFFSFELVFQIHNFETFTSDLKIQFNDSFKLKNQVLTHYLIKNKLIPFILRR